MSLTIDCGEGRHLVCSGSGTQPYLISQEAGPRFFCGCPCHHGGEGVPCQDPQHEVRLNGSLVTELRDAGIIGEAT